MPKKNVYKMIDDPEYRSNVSAVEATEAFLQRLEILDPELNAFVTVADVFARQEATRVDSASGNRTSPLNGMIIGVKDNIDVASVRGTMGSRFFADRVPEEDAEVVRRLRTAGAIIVGKTAMHEFAYGGTTNNPHYGPCRNPWDISRIPGGSSGGSGAALAADLCIGALGSDTGGSVRIPAALNGVSALRPTFGTVSNRGVMPISASFDTVGPMARSVRDVAHLFSAIVGYDREDPRAVDRQPDDPLARLDHGVQGLRIGLPETFFFERLEPDIEHAVRVAVQHFADLGAEVVDIKVPGAEEAVNIATIMIRAEALAIHRDRLASEPDWFGEDLQRRLALGDQVSGVDFADGLQQMHEWRQFMLGMFDQVDLILTPATNAVAPLIDEAEMIETTTQLTRFTYAWSLASMPALVIPCGLSGGGLPIGLQLASAPWQDALLLQVGAAYQTNTDWHHKRPPTNAAAVY